MPSEHQVAIYYFPNWHRQLGSNAEDFGEWGRLKAAKPRFAGHAQPKVPLWGYEDESDPNVMARKIDAAAEHGVDTFIFDWYFNDNGTHLERPLNEGYLKAKNNHRVKFALMWANHDLGQAKGAVPRSTFDKVVAHVVKDYMTHPSYWKIDGKAYFSIYEISTFIQGLGGIEEARKSLDLFREAAKAAGLAGVHLNIVDWQLARRQDAATLLKSLSADSVTAYVWVHHVPLKDFPETDYGYVQEQYFQHYDKAQPRYGVPYHPNVTMGWDATPRMRPDEPHDNRGYPNMATMKGNTPTRFKQALQAAKDRVTKLPPSQRIVTVNAWNEWTEGSYLEPDTVNKMAYLEAIREVFGQ